MPHFDFVADIERKAAEWDDFKRYRAVWDKIGERTEWNDEILIAYETERKAENNLKQRAAIDQKYLNKYAD